LLCLYFYKPVSLFGNRMTTTRFKRTRLIRVVDLDDDENMRFFSDFVLMK
jgi:ATP-dependent Clp protease adapter protein ClpS